MSRLAFVLIVFLYGSITPAAAHEIRPLLVEITLLKSEQYRVKITAPDSLRSVNRPEIILPKDCDPYTQIAGTTGIITCGLPLERRTLKVVYPRYNPAVSTMLTFGKTKENPAKAESNFILYGPDVEEIRVPSNDSQRQPVSYFIAGFQHILGGIDHLLFLVCLLAICKTKRLVLLTVTGFTVGHSATLALSALGLVAVPTRPVEGLIAFSIVVMAAEVLRGRHNSLIFRRPVLISSLIGTLHGFGFASFLSEVGLPQTAKAPPLFLFNLGVEAGQVLFLAVLGASYWLLRVVSTQFSAGYVYNITARGALYACGVVGSYWFVERSLSMI